MFVSVDKKIEAVVFDMDGILVDTEIVSIGIVDSFFRENGISLPQEVLHSTVNSLAFWQILIFPAKDELFWVCK